MDAGFRVLDSGFVFRDTWILDSNRLRNSRFLELRIPSPKSRIAESTTRSFLDSGPTHVRGPRQSWILDSRPRIPDFRYWIQDSLSVEFGFLIVSLTGFWIPSALSRIPKPRIPDSTIPECPLRVEIGNTVIWSNIYNNKTCFMLYQPRPKSAFP